MKRVEILVEMSHILQPCGFFAHCSLCFKERVDAVQFYIARNTPHSNCAAVILNYAGRERLLKDVFEKARWKSSMEKTEH